MFVQNLGWLVRFTNTLLLVLMIFLGLSGIILLYGVWLPWLFDLHRYAGFSLVVLIPWKSRIVIRSLKRGFGSTFDRRTGLLISLLFSFLTLLVIILAFFWMWRIGPYSTLTQTLLAWHWILGLLIFPLLIFHVWRHWPQPSQHDFLSRRNFLKLGGIAAAGWIGGGLTVLLAKAAATEAVPRRFTGSRGFGLFTGNDFPIFGESTVEVDIQHWRLAVRGAVRTPLSLTYEDVLSKNASTQTETVDCTSGWYSVQDWQGLPLIALLEEAGLEEAASGVRLVSVTGYNHTYPMVEAQKILLATHVTGEVLAPKHGFPLRAVVPGRRGWFWVKWLTRIEVLDHPLEVTGGILCSPREVLRQW